MAVDAPICRTVAVVLLLCSFIPSFSCFPQKSLGKFVPWQLASEKLGVRKGKILFNGKELNSLSESDVSGKSVPSLPLDCLKLDGWLHLVPETSLLTK